MIRLARLDLERWGHFEGHQLGFGPAGRLHVLFGHNEAGKSTTRRAVGALLFGVPERTSDTYGRPGSDLRVGARLEIDGSAVDVVRRKGRKNTLLDVDGAPLDPTPLTAALGGLTADVYGGLFEITHDSLVAGGHELLTGRGAVGEALFAAAAGTSRLQALLHQLEAEAEDLFSPRPSKRPLNARLVEHADALRRLREASLRPPEHERLLRELGALEEAYERAGAALDATERERARLERLRGALPLLALRRTREQELQGLGDVPTLGADAPARRAAAQEQRDAARAGAAAAARDLARRRERRAALAVDEDLLPFAEEAEALYTTAAAVAQDAARREELAGRRAAVATRLDERVAALAPALGERSVRDIAVDASARRRLEACLQARAGVEQAGAAAQDAVADARRAAERAEREAAAAPAAADERALAAAVRAARAAGSIDEQVARARADERAARRAAEQAAGRLVPPVAVEAVAGLAVPARTTVEARLTDVVEAQRAAGELEREAALLADRTASAQRQRDALVGTGGPLLDATALDAARAAREAAWTAVRAALTEPVAPGRAAELAAEHERAAAEADAVADARLQRAEDIARLADLERELLAIAHEAEEVAARRARHAAVVARADAAWAEAWSPAGDVAPTPAQAGAWLAGYDAVLAHLADADAAATEVEAASAVRDEHVRALGAALRAAGARDTAVATAPAPGAAADGDAARIDIPLATLVELADAHLDGLRRDAEVGARAAEAVARTAEALQDAEAALERAEARVSGWHAEWSELRGGCGLAESLAPADALAALAGLEQAARDQDELDRLDAELRSIDGRHTAFERSVAELVAGVGADLAEQPAPAAVAVLQRRVADARAAAMERDALDREVAALDAEREEADALVAAAEEELETLRAAAGAADDAELVRREQDSRRAEALRVEIADLDGKLALAGGAPAGEVAAAVAALDADAVPAQAEELAQRAGRERDARDAAAEALTRARDELARLERSDDAARAAQEAANLEAEIRELAQRYARARLAQRVLRDAIARYRDAHEGPLLARANVLFPALTCERYARLETDVDERDQDILVAITADGARRRVEELSDGTREQLFLALRLAAIEQHVAAATPVPVLFDDVLLESDDARAERVLTALADLAQLTQVLVFTHHRHLVEIAEATLPADRLDVVDLATGTSLTAETTPTRARRRRTPVPTLVEELETALAGAPGTGGGGDQQTLL